MRSKLGSVGWSALLLLLAISVVATSLPARASIVWRKTFPSGETAPVPSLKVVGGPPEGAHGARFDLEADARAGEPGWERKEWRRPLTARNTAEGTVRYYGFSLFVDKSLSAQSHQIARFATADTDKTLFALVVKGTVVDLVTYEPAPTGHYDGSVASLAPGKWHTVVVRVLWSADSGRGRVGAYYNGDNIVHDVSFATRDGNHPVVLGLGLSRERPAPAPSGPAAESLFVDDIVEATTLTDLRKYHIPKAAGNFFPGIEYTRPEGGPLLLDAWVPKGPGPHPAVILVHGGGFIRGDRQSFLRPMMDVLADAGIAWFSIDHRLAPRYKWPAPIEDIEAAVRWVGSHAARYRVNPRKVALFGESAGGFLVSAVGVAHKRGGPLAGVLTYYTSHAFDLRPPGPDGVVPMPRNGVLVRLFGITDTSSETQAKLKAAMPLYRVHADMPPYLVYHSDDDPAAAASTKMCAAMKAVGASCELHVSHNLGHGLDKWQAVPEEQERLLAWLRRTLDLGAPAVR